MSDVDVTKLLAHGGKNMQLLSLTVQPKALAPFHLKVITCIQPLRNTELTRFAHINFFLIYLDKIRTY